MSDPAADALGLTPEPIGPTPPDAETVARAIEAHEAFVANTYNQHDPASLCYRRPDLEARYRAEADAKFSATMVRHGATMPVPEPVEAIEARQFAERWPARELSPALVEELATRIVAAEAVPKAEQEKAIAEIKNNIGATRWAQLANTVAHPGMSKEAFITAEGGRVYEELVRNARLADPKLSAAALADKYTLEVYSAQGRYQAARNAARGNK